MLRYVSNRIVRGLTKTCHQGQIRRLSSSSGEPHLPLKDVMVVTLEQAVAAPYVFSNSQSLGIEIRTTYIY